MSEQDMENLDEKEKFDDNLISTETLHDIPDGNQTHPNIDKRAFPSLIGSYKMSYK